MQPVFKFLLSLAAASAVASAEHGMRSIPDVMGGDMPCSEEIETEHASEVATSLMMALNEHFHRSSKMLQNYFHSNEANDAVRFNEGDDAVRVVAIEQEEENPVSGRKTANDAVRFNEGDDAVRVVAIEQEEADPVSGRKTACLKAMEIIHEQEEVQQQTETLMRYIRSAFGAVSMQVWGGASCKDLGSPELVHQCDVVLKSEDVVQNLLQEDKTDDEVCDMMSGVSDPFATNNLSCKLCQKFVKAVDHALSQEVEQVKQVEQVRVNIGYLCDALSTDAMCSKFSKNYDAVVDWVKHDKEALQICSRITMC